MLKDMRNYGWKLFVLVLLTAFVFVWLVRAPILSIYFSKQSGLNLSIEWIGIWPSEFKMHNFSINNPSGYEGKAFQAKQIICDYKVSELFNDPAVIEQIEIQNSVLRIDLTNPMSASNNWTAMGEKMPKQKKTGHIIIRKLVLTNFNVDIRGHHMFVKPKQTHFDRLEFNEIDSQEGFPTELLVRLIFQSSGMNELLQDFFNPARDLQKVLRPLNIFGL